MSPPNVCPCGGTYRRQEHGTYDDMTELQPDGSIRVVTAQADMDWATAWRCVLCDREREPDPEGNG